MVKLTRKDTPFKWDNQCQAEFQKLKDAFTSAPILKHFDPEKEILEMIEHRLSSLELPI